MPRHRRLRLEPLEVRWLPATLVWTGAVSDRWDAPGNWNLRHVPTAADVAVIDKAGAVVQILSGSQRVSQLVCTQTLEITGGTLTIGSSLPTNRGNLPGLIGADLFDSVTTDDALADPSSLANLRMLGGTLNAPALEVTTSLVWGGGTLKGGTFTVSGLAVLNGGNKTLNGAEIRNLGTLMWASGRVRVNDDAALVNAPGAMFQINVADGRFEPKLLNNGTVVVNSSGVVEMAAVAQSGVLSLRGGTLKVGSFVQTDGVTDLQGGALASDQAVLLYGGSLVGSGTVSADVSAVAGRIAPGGGSTIVINGDLTLGNAAGVTVVAVVGGGNDQVVVTGQAVLDGELVVRLVGVPGNAVQYVVMTASNLTGGFKTVRTFAPGARVNVTVGGKAVVVEAAPIPVQPDQPADQTVYDGNQSPDTTDPVEEAEADLSTDPTSLVQFFGGQIIETTQASLSYAQSPFRLEVGSSGADLGGARKTTLSHESTGAARPEGPLEFTDPFAGLPTPALPELSLASDDDLLSSADLAASLLLGGRTRARLSSQGGTALSAVATVLGGEDLAAPVGPADPALGGLLVDPVGRLGNWPDATARAAEETTPVAALTKTAPAAVLAVAGLLLTARAGKRGKSGSRRVGRERREDGR